MFISALGSVSLQNNTHNSYAYTVLILGASGYTVFTIYTAV